MSVYAQMNQTMRRIRGRPLLLGAIVGVVVFALVVSIGAGISQYQQRQWAEQQRQAEQARVEQEALVLEAAALDQLDAGYYETAIEMLNQVIALAPRRSEPYYYRAVANAALGDHEAAFATAR